MKVIYIDPEPPTLEGGGIRSYIQNALALAKRKGYTAEVYTHNRQAYPADQAFELKRKAFIPWPLIPLRSLTYKWFYGELVILEYAYWIFSTLAPEIKKGILIEFADYLAYGFFCFRNKAISTHCLLRIHTPAYLIPMQKLSLKAKLNGYLLRYLEKDGLSRTHYAAALSSAFMQEKIPWKSHFKTVPITLPQPIPLNPEQVKSHRFLFVGRVEQRKGLHILIEAFLNYAHQYPQADLDIIGSIADNIYAEKLRGLINAHAQGQQIHFHAPMSKDQIQYRMKNAYCLVIPSLWENCPNVFFEGLAAGCLCLVAKTGIMATVSDTLMLPSFTPNDSLALQRELAKVSNPLYPYAEKIQQQQDYLCRENPKNEERIVYYYQELSA
jgi:glycosyltransferase involved in cell wall biosynthesis